MIDIITIKLPFIPERWIKWKDIERCPYAMFSTYEEERKRAAEWNEKDNERLTLIALDRYADYLKGLTK